MVIEVTVNGYNNLWYMLVFEWTGYEELLNALSDLCEQMPELVNETDIDWMKKGTISNLKLLCPSLSANAIPARSLDISCDVFSLIITC